MTVPFRSSFRGAALAGIGALALLAAPLGAQQPVPRAELPPRTIRVSGVGEARAQPDEARVELAVETQARTARAAGEENARIMQRVIDALVQAGVPRDEIETRGYSVFPEYDDRQPRPMVDTVIGDAEPRIRGYRAVNTVAFRTTALDRVGQLIDVALGAGANRLNGVGFGLRDDDAVRAEALRNAVADARRAAETMATALGVRLGAVVDASTDSTPIRPYPAGVAFRVADAEMAQSVRTPIEPGEQTVTATASLVYAIEGGR